MLSNLAFVLALLGFLAFDGMSIGVRTAVVERMQPDIAGAFSFVAGTRSYLMVSTVVGFIVAVFDGAALRLLSVPLPVLRALVSFVTDGDLPVAGVLGLGARRAARGAADAAAQGAAADLDPSTRWADVLIGSGWPASSPERDEARPTAPGDAERP